MVKKEVSKIDLGNFIRVLYFILGFKGVVFCFFWRDERLEVEV